MTITIRPECVKDYTQIAEINELAFASMIDAAYSSYIPEKNLVALLRHGSGFDPDLSLVAEMDGKIVGHALYYPFEMRLDGKPISAVSLGPIAAHPALQKQGIGMTLMKEGHRRAQEKGYAFSFLLGHPSYYPKVGYIMGMFGKCQLALQSKFLAGQAEGVAERLVQPNDIPALAAMWDYWFHDVDLAIFPGNALVDWVTHIEGIMSYTVLQGDDIIGYLRYEKLKPNNVKLFLAKDRNAAELLLAYLHAKLADTGEAQIHLPLHPASQAVKECLTAPYEIDSETWDAAMIKILDPENTAITRYCHEVRQGTRQPGLVIYPPMVEGAM